MSLLRFLLLTIVVLSASVAGCGSGRGQTDEEGDEPHVVAEVHVRAAAAIRRAMVRWVYGLGRCEALPGKQAIITATAQDEVQRLLVRPGEAVKAGQPLVELRATAARAALAVKAAERDSLEAALKLLESLPRPEERRGRELAVDGAKLTVEKLQSQVERLRPLQARNEIPQQQLYEAELALRQAQLQFEAAQSDLKTLLLGPRPPAVAEGRAKVAAAEKAVAAAGADLDLRTIRAPIAGVVESLACRLGETPAVGTPLGEIVERGEVLAVTALGVHDAQQVRVGQTARVNPVAGNGAARGGNGIWDFDQQALAGRVVFVGRVVDPQTGGIAVHVLVDDKASKLALGQTLAVGIVVQEKKEALVVQAAAVEDLGEGPVLNVIRAGKSVVLHPQLGLESRGWVEVAGTDLKPDELVIVDGGYNLPEGSKIIVDPPPVAAEKPGAAP